MLKARIEQRIKALTLAQRARESQVVRRMRAIRAPSMWRAAAALGTGVRGAGIAYRPLSASIGRSALRAGDVNEAVDALTQAVAGRNSSSTWREIADQVEHSGIDRAARPAWYYWLGEALHRLGEFEAAAALINAALSAEPQNSGWQLALAQSYQEAGDLGRAASALEQLHVQRAADDPKPGILLARIYSQAGQWLRAEQVLATNIENHPGHAWSHQERARVAESAHTWGGSFEGTLPSRIKGAFRFGAVPSITPAAAHAEAVRLQPARPTWRAALAAAQAHEHQFDAAVANYEALLDDAEASDAQWALGAKQKWQFGLEVARHHNGAPRVTDPLFDCELTPAGEQRTGAIPVPGFFDVRPSDNGFVASALLGQAANDQIYLRVNGRPLRAMSSSDSFLRSFTVVIKRDTLARFPSHGRFDVRTRTGESLLTRGGHTHLEFSIPHGDGSLLEVLDRGMTLDKKGSIRSSHEDAQLRHDRDLKIYSQARDFFDTQLNRPLFLLYGTLLGCYRDGDFIPGDDDFDVGYVSDKTTPEAVKEEAQDIVVALVRAGFVVSFNRRGRLFRIHLDGLGSSDCHLDVQFVWFQDGYAWAHNQARLAARRDDFLPPVEGTLRGTPVWLPHRPEVFLAENYGPGWKSPDPGFRYYPADVDSSVRQNLARSLLTVGEYKKLAQRIATETEGIPNAGRLVSLGSQDLYPLDAFIS